MKRTPLVRKTPLRSRAATPKVKHPERVAHGRMKRKATDMNALEELHVARVRKMPCLVTGYAPAGVAHHLMKAPGKRCRRDHRWVVPLTALYHNMGDRSVHALGSEAEFERVHGLAPGFLIAWAKREWEKSCE
jgi:hypothetical protein